MSSHAGCRRCAKVVPWASFWGNLSLAIYKLVVGILGGSAALIADAVHSFADVVGSSGILVATRVSAKSPDEDFPYGRGKAEFIGAAFVYTILLFFAGGIIIASVQAMLADDLEAPHFATLLGGIVSVFYNVVMYKYATCAGKRNDSPAILADAFENRADAISSMACIVGILGALIIHPICDPIAALVVGLIIAWNCQEQLREAATGLMDNGLARKEVEIIEKMALSHPEVQAVQFVRTRKMGPRFWADLGIEMRGDLGVEEADEVAAAIARDIKGISRCFHAEVYVVPSSAPMRETDGPLGEPVVTS
jgi:cation diffusion facilitator family transporter